MKSLFEEMGGTYRQEGDYLIPNLSLPDESEYQIGQIRVYAPQLSERNNRPVSLRKPAHKRNAASASCGDRPSLQRAQWKRAISE